VLRLTSEAITAKSSRVVAEIGAKPLVVIRREHSQANIMKLTWTWAKTPQQQTKLMLKLQNQTQTAKVINAHYVFTLLLSRVDLHRQCLPNKLCIWKRKAKLCFSQTGNEVKMLWKATF